ncbi:hypothetical protein ABK040_009805 [Willaertia magna]
MKDPFIKPSNKTFTSSNQTPNRSITNNCYYSSESDRSVNSTSSTKSNTVDNNSMKEDNNFQPLLSFDSYHDSIDNNVNNFNNEELVDDEDAIDPEILELLSEEMEEINNPSHSNETPSSSSEIVNNRKVVNNLENEINLTDKHCLYKYITVSEIASKYNHKKLYPWQAAILENEDILIRGKNLIYSSPTSGGKTLVSEILMMRRIIETQKKAIFILPFKAIIEEKVADLCEKFSEVGWVANAYHSEATRSQTASYEDDNEKVMVCTIERANSILNNLIKTDRINEISIIVIDELHHIKDKERGYLLELILTKLMFLNTRIQIIGMSATLPNVDKFANFLNAYLFITDYRPVPLTEYIVSKGNVYDKSNNFIRSLNSVPPKSNSPQGFDSSLRSLLFEDVTSLVFCSSKNNCKTFAKYLVSEGFNMEDMKEKRREIIMSLKISATGLDADLEVCFLNGVAFHHSALTMEEKKAMENAFREGLVRVLFCTTTLAAGVNLPARRVIISSTKVGNSNLDVTTYKQASGRAGRAGKDCMGESFLLVPNVKFGIDLVNAKMPPLTSCLERPQIARALLENIATNIIRTSEDIDRFVRTTFLFQCSANSKEITTSAIKLLNTGDFICVANTSNTETNSTKTVKCTQLGLATQMANICPVEALKYFKDIDKKVLFVENDLGVLFTLAPQEYTYTTPLNRGNIKLIIERKEAFLNFAKFLVGDNNNWQEFQQHISFCRTPISAEEIDRESKFIKLVHTMVLHDCSEERSIKDIAKKYFDEEARGYIQTLQKNAAAKAGVLSTFSRNLNWWIYAESFSRIKERLQCGVKSELLPLVQIPSVGAKKARALYNKGYKTIIRVAEEEVENISNILVESSAYSKEIHHIKEEAEKIVKEAQKLIGENTLPREWLFGEQEEIYDNFIKNQMKRKRKSLITPNKRIKDDDFVILVDLNQEEEFKKVLQKLEKCTTFSFCFDFRVKKPKLFDRIKEKENYNLVGVALCFNEHYEQIFQSDTPNFISVDPNFIKQGYYVTLDDKRFNQLAVYFKSTRRTKITFCAKQQQTRLLQLYKLVISAPIFDPLIGAWVHHPDDSEKENTLEEIYNRYFPSKPFNFIPRQEFSSYVRTAVQVWPVMLIIYLNLSTYKVLDMFVMEMSFVKVLSKMEVDGICFDYSWIAKNKEIIGNRLEEITKIINSNEQLHGTVIDLSKPPDVAKFLYDVLKLKGSTTRTNKDVLDDLKNRYSEYKTVIEMIQEYRTLNHIKNYHTKSLPNNIRFLEKTNEYKVFGKQIQTTSATGRLSVKDPNLQNIPHAVQINFEDKPPYSISVRSAFIPREGFVFVSADYRNIELRILGHASEDKILTDILSDCSRDIFNEIAMDFFQTAEVSKEQRDIIKHVIYGILYCMGSNTLSKKITFDNEFIVPIGEDRKETAERYKNAFFEKYPKVKELKKKIEEFAQNNLYVTTILDRKRFIHDLHSEQNSKREAAKRQILNSMCQGSAADIIKISMLNIYGALKRLNEGREKASMLLQIHDELLFEVEKKYLNVFSYMVQQIMQNSVPLSVPLPVKMSSGYTWGTLNDYSIIPLCNEEISLIKRLIPDVDKEKWIRLFGFEDVVKN